MKWPVAFLAFLLLLSVSFSVLGESYLLPNEDKAALKEEKFTANGMSYTLIKLGTKEIMLFRNDKLVANQTEIKDAIRSYYAAAYYPSDSELQSIRDLLTEYNYSRNDGDKVYKAKEENSCRDALFLNGQVKDSGTPVYCVDDEGCTRIGTLVYVVPANEGIRQSYSLQATITLVKTFAFASDGTSRLLNAEFGAVNSLSDSTLNSSLALIKNSTSALRAYKNTIEGSIFRTPRRNSSGQYDKADYDLCVKQNCFGICPSLDFNDTALDALDANAAKLLAKIAPFANYEKISFDVYNSTQKRVEFIDKESKAGFYENEFNSVQQDGQDAIKTGDSTLALVVNDTFQVKVARLKELDHSINESISKRNFTNIGADLDEYQALVDEVNGMAPLVLAPYNASLEAKREANAKFFVLSSRDLSGSLATRYNSLAGAIGAVDASFKPRLNGQDYENFKSAYNNITKEANDIAKAQDNSPAYILSSKLRAMAKNTNIEAENVLTYAKIPATAITANRTAASGAIALFIFLAGGSLVGFVFLTIYSFMKISGSGTTKIAFGSVFMLLMLGVLAFSGIFYIFLDKTANDAQFGEFLDDMKGEKSAIVLVDVAGAPDATATEMVNCGELTRQALASQNKTTVLYKFYGDSCIVSPGEASKSAAACTADVQNSTAIIMKYSAEKKKASFTSVFDVKAYIYGDESYYRFCSISEVFGK